MKETDQLNEFCANSMIGVLGIIFTDIQTESIQATMPVNGKTCQPNGFLHGGADRNDVVGIVDHILLTPQVVDLVFEGAVFDHPADREPQLLGGEGLRDEIGGAGLDGVDDPARFLGIGGDDDRGRRRELLAVRAQVRPRISRRAA